MQQLPKLSTNSRHAAVSSKAAHRSEIRGVYAAPARLPNQSLKLTKRKGVHFRRAGTENWLVLEACAPRVYTSSDSAHPKLFVVAA